MDHGIIFQAPAKTLVSLIEALKDISGTVDAIDQVWIAVNFWTLARRSKWEKAQLTALDVPNAVNSSAAIAWARDLDRFFHLVQETIPNAQKCGWMERYPARVTNNVGQYWYGKRIQVLNIVGRAVAERFGWRSLRTNERRVSLRDNVHPTDGVLLAVLDTLVWATIDD